MERYRVFWDASFDRLDAHLRRVQADARRSRTHSVANNGVANNSDTNHGGTDRKEEQQ